MLKKIKTKAATLLVSSLVFGTNLMAAGYVEGSLNINGNSNFIKDMLAKSGLISGVIQAGILFGILYSIFLIAKDLIGNDQGGGGKLWSRLGAIIAFAILYYFLFGGGMN